MSAKVVDGAGNDLHDFADVPKVGVGDIFVIAGQSNAASIGQSPITANEGVVQRSYNNNSWIPGTDPQMDSSIGTGMGSPWPDFANGLMAITGFPIALIDVAVSGTSVAQWQPGQTNYDAKLKVAVQSLPVNGFRAFLWHQGESDAQLGTSQADYTTGLEAIIAQSRIDAGWAIPWGVAEATYVSGGFPSGSADIQAAQLAVSAYTSCFLGANTDTLTGALRFDGTHFSTIGLPLHGALWTTSAKNYFGF